jgi:hypothetical protein
VIVMETWFGGQKRDLRLCFRDSESVEEGSLGHPEAREPYIQ